MSENADLNDSSFSDPREIDDRAPLALAVGLIMALVAGGLWALVGFVTHAEIGFAAWGIGLLVGAAMSRVTRERTQKLAYAAAALALLGLLAGKVFIFAGSTGRIATELSGNDEMMKSAVAWQMYEARELNATTLEGLDQTQQAGDTLSDALWGNMLDQASTKFATMTAEEKQETAKLLARNAMQRMGMVGGVRAQLSAFDLLWVFLAVGTAYRMLAPAGKQDMPEVQHA
jgi:hypothetical protein